MAGLAVVPAWVVPPPGQVGDAHRIARTVAPRVKAMRSVAAAFGWVLGVPPAPMSARLDEPTLGVVRGEMMLADSILAGRRSLPDDVWATLGASPVEAVEVDEVWARGVAATLAWLLGAQRRPPVQLPRRNPDGSPMTADQLYAEAVSRRHYLEPEDRRALRAQAERDAICYERLAVLATG